MLDPVPSRFVFSALPHASFIGRGLLGLGRKLVLSAVASWPQLVFSAAASLPVFSAFAFPHVLIVFSAASFIGLPVVFRQFSGMLSYIWTVRSIFSGMLS